MVPPSILKRKNFEDGWGLARTAICEGGRLYEGVKALGGVVGLVREGSDVLWLYSLDTG